MVPPLPQTKQKLVVWFFGFLFQELLIHVPWFHVCLVTSWWFQPNSSNWTISPSGRDYQKIHFLSSAPLNSTQIPSLATFEANDLVSWHHSLEADARSWAKNPVKLVELGVDPKFRGKTPPKMDGEHNGKTLFFNGWFGGKPHYFWKHPTINVLEKASKS